MISVYWRVLGLHALIVYFSLHFLKIVFSVGECYWNSVGSFLIYLIVASCTFAITKRRWLYDKVESVNKAVIITGCDSGFGNMLAKRLDGDGFRVFASCLSLSSPGARELKECSKRLHVFEMDVTKDDSVKNGVQQVKENLGTSDLWTLVNNAGVYRGISLELSTMDDYKACIEVNALGVVRVTKAFLPLLRQTRGRVVNLTSIAGRIALAHTSAYTMSKFAAVAFNDCMRQEMDAWGVKFISVEPEIFKTPMADPQLLNKNKETSLASIDEMVKRDYESHNKNIQYLINSLNQMATTKLYKVIDALELAVTLEHPDPVYRPSRNILIWTLCNIMILWPLRLQDIIYRTFTYIQEIIVKWI